MGKELISLITADPQICHGQPVFAGSRIMVYQILEMLEAGMNTREILENYPSLNQKHIQAALHFAVEQIARQRFIPYSDHAFPRR